MTTHNTTPAPSPLKKVCDVAIPCLILLASVGILIYYIVGPAEGYLHSDYTDTLWWAQATYDSHRLISENFHYAALLPFGGSLLMLPFIPLFGVSMTTHNIGMILFALLFIASLIFLARSLRFNWYASSALVFIVTMLLSSSDKLREIMWGHVIYYSLGLLFFCVGMGLVIRLQEGAPSTKRPLIPAILLFLFTAATATNGMQSLITYILPIVGALVLERIFAKEETALFKTRTVKNLATIGIYLFAALLGLLLLKWMQGDVSAGYASAYSTYSGMDEWLSNAQLFLKHWFSLLGISVEAREPIVSLKSVGTIIRIVTALFLLVFPCLCLLFYNKLTSRGVRTVLISHFVLSALIMYAYVFGLLASAAWRLTPMLGSAAITSAVCAIELIRPCGIEIPKRVGLLALCVLLMAPCLSFGTMAKMPADYGRDNHLHTLANALEEHELEYGYADFWLAQSITLLSDSRVKVRNVTIEIEEVTPYVYQSQYTWFDDQPDVEEYFLIVTNYQARNLGMWLDERTDLVRTIPLEDYTIYVFDNNLF